METMDMKQNVVSSPNHEIVDSVKFLIIIVSNSVFV